MAGAALGKLWDTHPRLAFALQTLASALFASLLVLSVFRRDWVIVAILGVGFVVEAASLVVFTREAAARGWTRSTW